jgi:hypothetical protein
VGLNRNAGSALAMLTRSPPPLSPRQLDPQKPSPPPFCDSFCELAPFVRLDASERNKDALVHRCACRRALPPASSLAREWLFVAQTCDFDQQASGYRNTGRQFFQYSDDNTRLFFGGRDDNTVERQEKRVEGIEGCLPACLPISLCGPRRECMDRSPVADTIRAPSLDLRLGERHLQKKARAGGFSSALGPCVRAHGILVIGTLTLFLDWRSEHAEADFGCREGLHNAVRHDRVGQLFVADCRVRID